MPRPIALLDPLKLNPSYIDALKAQNIQDIYFFMGEEYKKLEFSDKLDLNDRLKKEGFTICEIKVSAHLNHPELIEDSEAKALMLALFLSKKPDWVSGIMVLDDSAQVMESVQHYAENNAPPVPITTMKMTEPVSTLRDFLVNTEETTNPKTTTKAPAAEGNLWSRIKDLGTKFTESSTLVPHVKNTKTSPGFKERLKTIPEETPEDLEKTTSPRPT